MSKHSKKKNRFENRNNENFNKGKSSTDFVEDKSLHIPQKPKVAIDLNVRILPFTEKQKELIDLIQDKNTKVIFLKGPAGSSKSIVSVYCALEALNKKKIGEIIYIRNAVESSDHPLGYLKGDLESKMQPYLAPLMDKMEELLPKSQVNYLTEKGHLRGIPVGFLRGLSLNCAYIIVDEIQNASKTELITIMTRIGKFSKLLLLADEKQIDVRNSAYKSVFNAFDNQESRDQGIVTFEFGIDDIMREEVIKHIIKTFDTIK